MALSGLFGTAIGQDAAGDTGNVEDLSTSGGAGTVPTSDGGGGLTMQTPGGSGATLDSASAAINLGTVSAPDPGSTWDTDGFSAILNVDDMLMGFTSNVRMQFSGIDTETGPNIDADPNSIITSVAFFTDGNGKRQVRVTASGNSGGGGVVSWMWNGVTFTLSVTAT